MNFFGGFSWAVPFSFSDAVAQYAFNEGDVLYQSREAYLKPWGEFESEMIQLVKVKDLSDAENGSWDRPCVVEYSERLGGVPVILETSQGGIYTTLWRGDSASLQRAGCALEQPLLLADVVKKFRETSFDKASAGREFLFLRDLSNPASRTKYLKLETVLEPFFSEKPVVTGMPMSVDIEHRLLSPTIEFVRFLLVDMPTDHLTDLIKKAVYVPAKGAKKEMFRLSAHGHLL
jgi:hypothetical protein